MLDLCGSSVSFAPVRQVLLNCTQLRWLNLSSCRALPRGIKRLYDGVTLLKTLREAIQQGKYDDNEQQQDDWGVRIKKDLSNNTTATRSLFSNYCVFQYYYYYNRNLNFPQWKRRTILLARHSVFNQLAQAIRGPIANVVVLFIFFNADTNMQADTRWTCFFIF